MNIPRLTLVLAVLAFSACTPGRAPAPIPSEGPRSFFSATGRLEQAGISIDRAAFSPNGEHLALAVSTGDGYRLGLARAARISIVPIDPPVEVNDFAWMPDGESVLIAYHAPFEEPVTPYFDSLAVVDLRGRIMRRISLTRKLRVERSGLAVAPDGSRAYMGAGPEGHGTVDTDLYEVELATGATRQLTRTSVVEDIPKVVATDRLIFVLSEEDRSTVAALDLKTGRVTRLSPPEHVVGTASVLFGGDTIIYDAHWATGSRQRAVWAMSARGGEPQLVAELEALRPALHPDGRHAVIHVIDGFGGGYLRLVTLPS